MDTDLNYMKSPNRQCHIMTLLISTLTHPLAPQFNKNKKIKLKKRKKIIFESMEKLLYEI